MNRHQADSTNPIRRSARVLMLSLLAGGVLSLASCEKKEEAAPPQPPPPPPPVVEPTAVSFDSISQELGADPRVQFASDVSVTDEMFAKAVVKLADAVARGDAGKLRALVNSDTRKVLQTIENDGLWDQGMAGVEAVRVVYAAPYDASANKVTLDTALKVLEAKSEAELPPNVTPEMALRIAAAVSGALNLNLGVDPNAPADAGALKKLFEKTAALTDTDSLSKFLNDAEFEGARKVLENMLEEAQQTSGLPNGKFLVLLAVQDQDGAELSGWGAAEAFGGLEFNIGGTVTSVKPRATGFDGVGLAGFNAPGRQLAASGEESGKPAAEKAPEEKPAEGEKKDDEPDPSKKRTPSGPIQIPGG